jgi:hypothetical protein
MMSAGRTIERVEDEAGGSGDRVFDFLTGMSIQRMGQLRSLSASCPRLQSNSGVRVMIAYDDGLYQASATADDLGPLPRAGAVAEFTDLFRDACKKGDPEARAEAARWFYADPRNYDPALLGGLEIVDERGRRDLDLDSKACLLILDGPPGCQGLQLPGRIETVGPGNHRYEFLLQAREVVGGEPAERPVAFLFRVDRS